MDWVWGGGGMDGGVTVKGLDENSDNLCLVMYYNYDNLMLAVLFILQRTSIGNFILYILFK